MQLNRIVTVLVMSVLSLPLLSCDQAQGESKIAKAIRLSVTSSAIVLPTDLTNEIAFQTCIADGVTGPRVRMRAAISWPGLENGADDLLIPLTISLNIRKGSGAGDTEYTNTIGATNEFESISLLFGLEEDDFIPADGVVYSSNQCFLDFGDLPKPTSTLSGSAQQYVPATVRMMGIVRNAVTLEETPFVKEVNTKVLYVAGSIPED